MRTQDYPKWMLNDENKPHVLKEEKYILHNKYMSCRPSCEAGSVKTCQNMQIMRITQDVQKRPKLYDRWYIEPINTDIALSQPYFMILFVVENVFLNMTIPTYSNCKEDNYR